MHILQAATRENICLHVPLFFIIPLFILIVVLYIVFQYGIKLIILQTWIVLLWSRKTLFLLLPKEKKDTILLCPLILHLKSFWSFWTFPIIIINICFNLKSLCTFKTQAFFLTHLRKYFQWLIKFIHMIPKIPIPVLISPKWILDVLL